MPYKLLDSIGESLCLSASIVEWEQTKNIKLNPYAKLGGLQKNFNIN